MLVLTPGTVPLPTGGAQGDVLSLSFCDDRNQFAECERVTHVPHVAPQRDEGIQHSLSQLPARLLKGHPTLSPLPRHSPGGKLAHTSAGTPTGTCGCPSMMPTPSRGARAAVSRSGTHTRDKYKLSPGIDLLPRRGRQHTSPVRARDRAAGLRVPRLSAAQTTEGDRKRRPVCVLAGPDGLVLLKFPVLSWKQTASLQHKGKRTMSCFFFKRNKT